jgi:hypothetical protein
MKRTLAIIATAIFLAGCASSGVQPAGPDTYIVSHRVTAFDTTGSAKAANYQAASEWCAQRGLVMVPVSSDAQPMGFGHPGSAELLFRALKPGDPEIKRANVESPDHTQRIELR